MSDGAIVHEDDIQFHQRNDIDDMIQQEMTLDEYIQTILNWYLKKYNNNILLVADKLKMGKSTIYRMLKEGKLKA